MSDSADIRRRMWWILPPIVVGVAVLMWAKSGKQPPTRAEQAEPTHAVRVVNAAGVSLVPMAEGYGAVQPARVWTAVAQVAGRLVQVHERLRDGEVLPAGTELFRIDPVDYELSLAQANAELAELEVQENNARASLAIEERNLAVAERELARIRKLAGKGTASRSDADSAERAMLGSRTAVQNMRNTLALIPTQRRLLEARRAQAERDLSHTVVSAPFNMRVADLAIEADQYVAKGQSLFQGDAVDRIEVVAQVAMASLRRLFIGREGPAEPIMGEQLRAYVEFKPVIRLDMGGHVAEWQAEFVRFSDHVDAQTRTMGVVVAVDRPFDKIRPGLRPPLSKGMFVQLVLRGRSQPGRVVVPRAAVRSGAVYLAGADNRLQRRTVEVLFSQGELSVIGDGVEAGERVVVSDLVPAVTGMALDPRPDAELQNALAGWAGAES